MSSIERMGGGCPTHGPTHKGGHSAADCPDRKEEIALNKKVVDLAEVSRRTAEKQHMQAIDDTRRAEGLAEFDKGNIDRGNAGRLELDAKNERMMAAHKESERKEAEARKSAPLSEAELQRRYQEGLVEKERRVEQAAWDEALSDKRTVQERESDEYDEAKRKEDGQVAAKEEASRRKQEEESSLYQAQKKAEDLGRKLDKERTDKYWAEEGEKSAKEQKEFTEQYPEFVKKGMEDVLEKGTGITLQNVEDLKAKLKDTPGAEEDLTELNSYLGILERAAHDVAKHEADEETGKGSTYLRTQEENLALFDKSFREIAGRHSMELAPPLEKEAVVELSPQEKIDASLKEKLTVKTDSGLIDFSGDKMKALIDKVRNEPSGMGVYQAGALETSFSRTLPEMAKDAVVNFPEDSSTRDSYQRAADDLMSKAVKAAREYKIDLASL